MDLEQSSTRLIVALDFHSKTQAWDVIAQMNAGDVILKVGSEMFTLFGPEFVKALIKKHFRVFLDLKFHDIPQTVARACASAADLGVWMMNVHASGGVPMMEAAVNALQSFGQHKPLLIAVTVLTSLADHQLNEMGVARSLSEQVGMLSECAKNTGLDGVVCSAREVPMVKKNCGQSFLTVTPGIRMDTESGKDDQVRVATVQQALNFGSDYLVIGRPITRARNPGETIQNILACMAKKNDCYE